MKGKVLLETVKAINSIKLPHPVRVGIDGVSASGKTRFADDLVEPLKKLGRHVIRASIDGFHNPQDIRYQQGEHSSKGYVEDSFNYGAVVQNVLGPLGPTGQLKYKRSLFNFVANENIDISCKKAKPDSILIFEGVLLFCSELNHHWDYKIFIDASFETIINRAMLRDDERLGGNDKLLKKYYKRYIPGQKAYLVKYKPHKQANIVVNNNNYHKPYIVRKTTHNLLPS